MVGGFRLKANQLAYWCWCLMLFFIPFSTALGLLMSALAIVSGCLGFSPRSFRRTFKQPVIVLCVLLFVWLTLSMLWSMAPKAEMLEAWSKYRKLLYPALVMMVLYNLRKGPGGLLYGFLAGCGVIAVMSLLSAYGILELILGPPRESGGWYVGPGWLFIGGPENPTFGRNHITQSAFLSFAVMLSLGNAWHSGYIKLRFKCCLIWLCSAIIYLQPIFLLQGRTGYLLALIIPVYFSSICLLYMRGKKKILIPIFAGVITAVTLYSSPHFLTRTKVMGDSVANYVVNGELKDSGVRLEFWRAGLEIFSKYPFIGTGVGGYAEAYSRLDGRSRWLAESRVQPHSEYVLMAIQGGAVGAFVFSLLCVAVTRLAIKQVSQRPAILGLVIIFFLDAVFNSVIWDLAEGHFFVMFIALSIYPTCNAFSHFSKTSKTTDTDSHNA